jgi:ABC-type transport system substrate-binding protein
VIWSNPHRYVDPKVDELLAGAGRERDPVKRKALCRDFQRIVVDDCPIAFLYEPDFPIGCRRIAGPRASVRGMMAPQPELGVGVGKT